ncbi:MAG: ABC transporter permease [Flavobacteriales bacterium]|nr:ABC transporter permease [Flavobacteriales bacterium]MCB9448201.1 ABC transporter permease [Flavobacteriales bacterium]
MTKNKEIRTKGHREGLLWRELRRNKGALASVYLLAFLAVIALLAPMLANNMPLYMSYRGQHLFPAFSFQNKYHFPADGTGPEENIQLDIADWKHMNCDAVIWAPVTYDPQNIDIYNARYVAPGGEQVFKNPDGVSVSMPPRFRHWLGTGKKGEDVLSGLIHGTRVSLSIGFISMGIAAMLGILLGAIAGYFGDHKLTTTRGQMLMSIPGLILGWFYGFQCRTVALSEAMTGSGWHILGASLVSVTIMGVVFFVFIRLGKLLSRIPYLGVTTRIPADSIISRLIEIFISIPNLILIITISAIARPSMINLMVIIGLTTWTGIARLTRAELLKIRNLEYIQAGQALGLSEWRVILKHALPNGIAPALISVAFGIANAILVESALSFLGIGVPPETVTWGSMLFDGREHFEAWWLVIFPGLAIFFTVTAYNLLGEGIRDAIDPKARHRHVSK